MDAVEFLRQMLEIESLSRHEQELAEFLVERMDGWGFDAHVDEAGNAVGVVGDGPNEIVLLGHMDTVPGRIPVRIDGERLYGRGAVDAKGPLATFIVATATAGPLPGMRIIVIGATEEEAATSKGARFAAQRYRPSACIIGEPSGWDGITLGYKGRLLIDYHLERPMGHTAGPERSVAEEAVTWWQALRAEAEAFNAGRDGVFNQLLPSLREIRTQSDGLTNSVEATVAFRLPPSHDTVALERSARELAGESRIRCYGYEPAFRASKNTRLVRAFLQAIRAEGGRPTFKLKTGTSDMNVVGSLWNCPIVAHGPGDSTLDHTPDEHIHIPEYLRAIDVLGRVLRLSTGTKRN
ncbi:MAG: [LysW]-lysine hydrolase [Anaerolineae bacterium]